MPREKWAKVGKPRIWDYTYVAYMNCREHGIQWYTCKTLQAYLKLSQKCRFCPQNDLKWHKTTSFPGKWMFWTDSRYAYIVHYIFSQYHSILLLREFYYWINKKNVTMWKTQKRWFLILGGCPGNMECMHTFEIVLSSKCSVLRYFEIFGNTSNSSSNKGQPAFEISLR